MPRLGKPILIDTAIAAIEAAGWEVERLSARGDHPARFRMTCDGVEQLVRLYIWNLSHGGRTRSDSEFRIQVTGVDGFELEPGGRTLILGWSAAFGAFAGFDVRHRLGAFGTSPSIQVNAATLAAAGEAGASIQSKGPAELAVAIRPDRLSRYVQHLDQVHAGNLSALLADEGAVASDPLAAELALLAESEVDASFGSDADRAARAAVDSALDDLEEVLAASKPNERGALDHSGGRIGHNQPPGPISDEEPLGPQIERAGDDVRAELEKSDPDARRVGLAGSFLAWAARFFQGAMREGGQLFEKGKDLAREYALKALWGTAGTLGVTFKEEIVSALRGVAKAILNWLQIIG